jgi:DNA-binding CsgD family transcriptional regulator
MAGERTYDRARVIPLRAPATRLVSNIQAVSENPTELRVDYKDLVAGQLVIVIHGLPTADNDAVTPRNAGPPTPLATGTNHNRGHVPPSSALIEEAEAIGRATGYTPVLFTPLLRTAWRGQEALALELIAAMVEEATAEDAGRVTVLTEYAKAVLLNGLGRYAEAVVAAQRACAQDDLGVFERTCLELVEACARSDTRAAATDVLRALDERTRSDGTGWALGVRAWSAALLSESNAAETLYREAIERFDRDRIVIYLARAQLVYGEWLRRENRRVDAREQLRAAHSTFCDIAAEAFAERARRELHATGETARRRTEDTRDVLTPQEVEIARLARDGLSNPEIGAHLFISPRTVQYHLRKVFRKLDITSRNQLGRLPASRLSAASQVSASTRLSPSASELAPQLATRAGASADASASPARDPRLMTHAPIPIREVSSW